MINVHLMCILEMEPVVPPCRGGFAAAGESFASLVDVDLDLFRRRERGRVVRRNITLPEWLDEMASEEKINVSAVVQSALKKELCVRCADC